MKAIFCVVFFAIITPLTIFAQSPGDVSGLTLWLKPDAGVTESSGSVSQWADQSGNGFNGAPTGGGFDPGYSTATLNGYNFLEFDGSDNLDFGDVLNTGLVPQTDDWSFFLVYNIDNSNTGTIISRAGNTNRQWQYSVNSDLLNHTIGSSTGGSGSVSSNSTVTGDWIITSSLVSTSNFNSWLDGSTDVTSGTIGTQTTTVNVYVGARTDGSSFPLTGDIAEIILFDTELSASDRRDVETYLALKYGLTIDISSEDYTLGGTSIYGYGSFASDIAGLALDNSQGLDQSSATSHTGNVITMSNATDLEDNEYFIWGSDDGVLTTTTSDIPASSTSRVTRIWRVDETPVDTDVGTVDVTFNLTSIGVPSTGDYQLLISSTTDFSGIIPITGGTTSTNGDGDDIITFSAVDFADGDHFTLGLVQGVFPGNVTSGLELWLDADDGITLNGSTVSDWADQSVNGNDGTQGNANSQPYYKTNVVNGHASLEFNIDYMDAGDILDYTTDFSVFAVFKTTRNGRTIISRALDNSGANRQWQLLTNETFNVYAGGNQSTGTDIVENEKWTIGSSIFGTTLDTYINGNQEVSGGTIGAATETTNVIIGARTNGTLFNFEGDITEIIAFDFELSAAQRRDVETYLALKYGITLDITSEAYTLSGTSIYNHTPYPNDIAGLIVDDSQDINQTSSKSIEGRLFTFSNAGDLDDGESLIWGHDGNNTTLTTSDVGALTNRLERIWRLDETGDIGTVDITLDLTALGIDTDNSDVRLIVAGSGATMPTGMASATDYTGTTSTSDGSTIITFSAVDFNDGEFFTFAGNLLRKSPGGISQDPVLWLKANGGVKTASVMEWLDESGNSNNAIQDYEIAKPSVESGAINGNAAISFDGTSSLLNSVGGFYSNDFFVVINPIELLNHNTSGGRIIGTSPTESSSLALGVTSAATTGEVFTYTTPGSAYRAYLDSVEYSNPNPIIINMRHNGVPDGQDIYVNGINLVNTESGTFSQLTDQPFQLGGAFAPSETILYNGEIGEVIGYDITLGATNRRDVESYLAIKYGISLDISSEAYTVGGSAIFDDTNFGEDIAGIGRNFDSQSLNQSSSKSVNNGSIVEISSPTDLDDGEYLVWGNDGGSNNFVSTEVPDGAQERLDKIWKIAETGDVGTVSIAFDITDLNIDLSNATLNLVQVDAGATIPNDIPDGTTTTGGTLTTTNGRNILTFTELDFSDGQYFTLVGDINAVAPGGVLTNLSIWLLGDDGVSQGGSGVNGWSDNSGNGINVTQDNSSDQPTLLEDNLNYHDVIDFDSQFLEGASGFATQDIFLVVDPDNTISSGSTLEYPLSITTNDDAGVALGAFTANLTNEVISYTLPDLNGDLYQVGEESGVTTYDEPIVLNIRNNSTADGQEIYLNGALLSTTEFGASDFSNYTNQPFRIGDNFSGAGSFDGKLAEIVDYSTRNSDANRRDIESYLALKYGITLDISSENYTDGGAAIYQQTGYANDIAGIGLNELNAFDQSMGHSINTDAIIELSGASDLGDGEYLIFGNDGSDKTLVQSTEIPASFQDRLTTEWVAEKTGNPGTCNVQIYIGGITSYALRGQEAELYHLLLSDDTDFSSIINSYTASSLTGDTLVFENVDFSQTLTYFTIAVPEVSSPGATGLALWLRADKGITLNGTDVTDWLDQSGNGLDADADGAIVDPTFVDIGVNNNPSISFDGTQYMSLGDVLDYQGTSDEWSTFIVYNVNTNNTGTFIARASTTVANRQWQYSVNSNTFNHTIGGTQVNGSNTVTGAWRISSSILNTSDFDSYTDGDTDVTNGAIGSNTETENVVIGARTFLTPGFLLTGEIAEIIMFDNAIGVTDQRDIETYLALKYGITLNISSADYTMGGSTIFDLTSYSNDIAGIATNASQGFSQTNSSSSNTDAIVTVFDPATPSDGDYLVWGNDDGVTTATSSTLPPNSGIQERMTRLWGVSETGDVGEVSISFDLTGLGYGAKDISDFQLIVDTVNGDFSLGVLATYSAASFSSEIVTFNDVEFTTATIFGLGVTSDLTTDGDSDGIPDYFETAYGTDPTDGDDPVTSGGNDDDSDGISNALETILTDNGGDSPVTIFSDTDGDGIPDHIEVFDGSNPFSSNSPTQNGADDDDSDGLTNALEALINSEGGTANASINSDFDSDGIFDYFEIANSTAPGDVNDPVTNGGTDTDTDGISDAFEAVLISGGSTGPIDTETDTDEDGIPDYIEGQTTTDPYNQSSPTVTGGLSLRSILADYVATGANCIDISGYQWIDVTDNLGNLVYSINPVGNSLGTTCFGIRALDGQGNVRDNSEDWVLNRSWYITPSAQPSSIVYLRLYSLSSENTDLFNKLVADGVDFTGITIDDFNADSIKITKISSLEFLDALTEGGTRSIHDPIVMDYNTDSKSYTIGINSFSTFVPHFGPGDPDTPLPIELTDFKAKASGSSVLVQWTTASETDNEKFELLRSTNGKDFSKISTMKGAGTSNKPLHYEYVDSSLSPGNWYYQLRQTDFDGSQSSSSVIFVNISSDASTEPLIYPNATSNYINIIFDATSTNNGVKVQLINSIGQSFTPNYSIDGDKVILDVSNLNNGLYILNILSATNLYSYRVIKE